MNQGIQIRELRRHEIDRALEFARPLGVELGPEEVKWTLSLTAVRGDAWVAAALTAPDETDTLRVWVVAVESLEDLQAEPDPDAAAGAAGGDAAFDRGGLICRLIDKAMLKLRSEAAGACAVTVCGEAGEAVMSRTVWAADAEVSDVALDDEAGERVRSLDEVLDKPPAAGAEEEAADEGGEAEGEPGSAAA
ncbi:MAG: hypothetical protein AAF823_03715 [Planctomycetota bacterium]